MKNFSVIIPAYNEEVILRYLLDDLSRQSLQPDEVIVADADSTDDTVAVAREYGVRVVEGGLPGVGRNRGAEVAKGEYLVFLDADVRLFDVKFLEKAKQEIEQKNIDVATSEILPLTTRWIDYIGHLVYNGIVQRSVKAQPIAPGSFIFCKKALHDAIGGFDEEILLAEDQDYVDRASEVGKFDVLQTFDIYVSVRRFDKDGRLNVVGKYMLSWLHIKFIGPIKHGAFKYSFGYEDPQEKEK